MFRVRASAAYVPGFRVSGLGVVGSLVSVLWNIRAQNPDTLNSTNLPGDYVKPPSTQLRGRHNSDWGLGHNIVGTVKLSIYIKPQNT